MSLPGGDPALDTLLLPLASGALAWPAPGQSLFLRARAGLALNAARAQRPFCEQSFKPWAEALARDGFEVAQANDGHYQRVLVLAPRQRAESRALLVRALDQCLPGGTVLACAANSAGARSLQDDLTRLAGPLHSLSKNHCRVCWTGDPAARDAGLMAQWRDLDAPRPVADGRFLSRPGLFAWDRIDAASALLAQCLPPDLAGRGADLGAGFGYLACELLARCPGVAELDLYEAEARALDLCRANLADARVPVGYHWHDVTAGLPKAYDFVVSNPPFHQGRADEPALGQAFIAAAAAALRPGGRLLLVANRHLPYEVTLARAFGAVRVLLEQDGFKVIIATKADAT